MPSLPTELLSKILLLTFPDDPQKWCIRDVGTLALVCRRWHDLVLESPLFWPLISISHTLEIVNLVLKRNPTGPLDVDLNRFDERLPNDRNRVALRHRNQLAGQITHQALSHASRWRHVNIWDREFSPEMMSIIEKAESAESLLLLSLSKSTIPPLNLSHFSRLKLLHISQICIDWINLPQLPFLQTLVIDHTTVPEIEHLHGLFGSAPRLDSISLRNLRSLAASEHGLDMSGQQILGLPPVSLTGLTRLALYSVPSNWCAHVLAIIRSSKPFSLYIDGGGLDGGGVDSLVFQNHNFHQLAMHALIRSGPVYVTVHADTMFVTCAHTESEIAGNRTKMGYFYVQFTMPKFDEWQRVFQGLGAIVGSKSIIFQIGSLGGISIADLMETLKSAPNILRSVRSIEILNALSPLTLLGLLSREYVDDLGQATWLAPGLEELILPAWSDVDHESMMYALEQLWLGRYARLGTYPNGCSRLRRLACRNKDFVAKVRKDGLFPGTVVEY